MYEWKIVYLPTAFLVGQWYGTTRNTDSSAADERTFIANCAYYMDTSKPIKLKTAEVLDAKETD